MKRIIIICLIVFCFSTISNAQDYRTGIGLRGGYFTGLTIKHFLGTKTAFEGIVASRWRGFGVTGLFEFHNQAFQTERMKWYIGFGGHAGFWNGDNTNWGTRGTSYTVIGIDGILGLEYNFLEIPFNIGIDWKPTLNLSGYSGFWADDGAISIRYIF